MEHPLHYKDERVGTLYLTASAQPLRDKVRQYHITMASVLGALLLVPLFAALRLQKKITRPLVNLTAAARRITEEEDYSVRAEKTSDDEIGVLCDAFNRMLGRLEERQRERDAAAGALKKSEARFRHIIEQSNDAMYVLKNERFVFINPRFEQYFGYGQAETIANDRRVMWEACLQVAAWHKRHPRHRRTTLSANVSSKQFLKPELIDFIQKALTESGLGAGDLKLEITESVAMSNPENTTAMLLRLKALDVRLQIDDFGTGYSSLSYLQRFHIDSLKIDRSFIHRLGADEESLEIVKTIILLARNLHMEVLAEGVETEAQLDLLRGLGCNYAQGFYFCHPVPADEIDALLEKECARPP